MAAALDPAAFPAPAYELAYLYGQPSSAPDITPDAGQDLPGLDHQRSVISPPDENTSFHPVKSAKRRKTIGAQGHGIAGPTQESDSMIASELNGPSMLPDAALPANRPKRVRTGMLTFSDSFCISSQDLGLTVCRMVSFGCRCSRVAWPDAINLK